MSDQCRRSSRRAAFTLLELVLTVSMSVVLMALIGAAIQFYARDMDVNDMDIRQTQLAAAIMQMIEDDLRGTVHNDPVDMSGLGTLLSSVGGQTEAAAAAGGAGGGAGGGSDSSGADLSAAGVEPAEDPSLLEEEAEAPDLTSGVAVLQSPGLIGNQFQIQIDVSRLPRLEEYVTMLDETVTDLQDVPSDLKTVTYFVQPAGAVGVVDSLTIPSSTAMEEGGGLVRRSLDRAATTYAATNGSLAALAQTGDLLAPEVLAIEFSYWDGTIWELEWSSDEFDELPLAVQVKLTMSNPIAASAGLSADDENATRVFTHVIRIPMAKPIELETGSEELSEAGI
jgi:type II secretory pathway pseudopilin PulG